MIHQADDHVGLRKQRAVEKVASIGIAVPKKSGAMTRAVSASCMSCPPWVRN
jgi:hypothetical protein